MIRFPQDFHLIKSLQKKSGYSIDQVGCGTGEVTMELLPRARKAESNPG